MQLPALERCVGDVERFLNEQWGSAPFLSHSADRGGFDDLASLDDLDTMVASLGQRASNLRMVRDGKPLAISAYTSAPGSKSRTTDRPVDAASVYKRFDEGATIVLESLHRYWRPLTDFCRDLETALGHRLQVNAYITPSGSRGFDVHRDSHDVFVLQVSGAKHWIVFDSQDENKVLIDREIEVGDALYIPAGFPHAASAGTKASAHLTVGILTHDSIDIVREIAKLAEGEPAFSDRLPVGCTQDPQALRQAVVRQVDELRAWLDKVDLDELTERMARKVMGSAQPVVRGQLRQLELVASIDEDTMLVRRSGAVCVLFPRDTSLKVLLVDRELQMPLSAQAAMREVAGRSRLQVRDLHRFLTPESALVLVRRLIREGLLEVLVGE
jgi:uncharacterized RmlC-like cupin family protein